jgi:TetR/AcrR family transcriptional regulator
MKRPRVSGAAREALLNAATEVFAERGFEGATVGLIARRARVNPAMISYYFGGKKKLYQAILSETFDFVQDRADRIRHSPLPAPERLGAFINAFRDMALIRPSFPRMMAREAVSEGRHLERKFLPRFLDIFQLVREIIDQGVKEGDFSPAHPGLTHLSLIGSMVFFYATEPFRRRLHTEMKLPLESLNPDDFVNHSQELILRGLLVRRKGTKPPTRQHSARETTAATTQSRKSRSQS